MKLLDRIRVINMYILIFSSLFILQKYTIGLIPRMKEIILFNEFYLYEIIFAINAAIFIKLFIKIGIPKNS